MSIVACPCLTWERLWEETQGGKYPPSEHHPRCEQFKPLPFVSLELDGVACIFSPGDAEQFLADADDASEYTIKNLQLTQDQYEAMPEFEGY